MPRRIAIIGSGPVGLEAALYSRALGHSVFLLERAPEPAANVAAWQFVRLFSPWKLIVTPLGLAAAHVSDLPLDACPTGRELRDQYLLPIARSLSDELRLNTSLLAVGLESDSFRLLFRDAQGNESVEPADVILDCSGTYGQHRFAGQANIPAPGELALQHRIRYALPDVLNADRDAFANRHTLLMGSGFSAATVLRDLQSLVKQAPETRVTWAIRRPGAALHPLRDDPLHAREALVLSMLKLTQYPPHWLEFLNAASLESVEPRDDAFRATVRSSLGHLRIDADQLVCLVGYAPDDSFHKQFQPRPAVYPGGPIRLSPTPTSLPDTTEVPPEPAPFFILGAKSYGTDSQFLLQAGHRQVRDVFRIIEQKPRLDLYQVRPSPSTA